jgi:hypothetical protein
LRSHNYKARAFGWLLALGVMLATQAWAQIEIKDNTSLSLSGDLGYGYNASYGNQVGSAHGTSLSGDAVLQGYYYNPKFLSFFVDPIYNRSQANSGEGSITDASSVNAGVNLFSGSHFPGTVSFTQAFNSSGNYGLGTTPGFTTTGRSHGFGIGWSELVPGIPPLSVQYTQNASDSSIFGTDQEDHSGSKNLNMYSNYRLAGWYMGATFTDTKTHVDLPSAVTDEQAIEGDTSSKSLSFNTSHRLPLQGSFGAGYTYSDFSGENNGAPAINGSNQTITATAAFTPIQRLTSSFQLNYNTSLAGEVEQQLAGAGAVNPQVNLGTSSYSVSMSNYDNMALGKGLSLGFGVGHVQQEVYGETVSATHFSAVVNYRFLKPLWGTVVVYAGVNDQATDAGNQGAGLVAGANFSKQWSSWDLTGSFGYSQDTQTVLATQVTSNYSYLANAQHRLSRRVRWMATFNGFHTGLGEIAGESAHSESYGTNLVYKMYNVGANYSHTSGTVLLTGNGLITPPGGILPIAPGNAYLLDTGSSYSFSFTANPTRKLVVSTSYTKTINDSAATALTAGTGSNSKVFLVFTEYQYRKLVFSAGYTNLNQFVSTSGLPQASYSNFYVGLQRWFKAF